MKQYAKNINFKKRIMLLSMTTILMNNAIIAQDTRPLARIRALFPSWVSKTKTAVKTGLSSVYQKVRSLNSDVIISRLINNLQKLGGQVGHIKDCMLFGFQCSPAERRAFYATAITILALTAVLVGFTITVAATSTEPDKELNKAIESTSQSVTGWTKEAIFQRLNNTITSFKNGLTSMQSCLKTRKCARSQRRALYATAATIVALVTIVLGLGVGSYLYAEHKKKMEEAELPGETPVGETPLEPVPEGTPKEKEFRPTFEFDERSIEEKPKSKFQQFFRKNITIVQEKTNALRSAYQEIKEQVKTGVIKTKEAATEKFLEMITKAKKFPDIIQNVLQVNLSKFRNAVQDTKKELATVKEKLSTKNISFSLGSFRAQLDDFTAYIKSITDNVAAIASGVSKARALKTLFDIKRKSKEYFEQKIKKLRETRTKSKEDREKKLAAIEKAERKLYLKDFFTTDNLKTIYPTILEKTNELDIYKAGRFANSVLHSIASLLKAAQSLHKNAGKIGLIISQDNIQRGLWELQYGIESIGKNIKNALENKPLIVTNQLGLKDLAKSLIEAATTSHMFGFLRENFGKIRSTKRSLAELSELTDSMQLRIEEFKEQMTDLRKKTKETFIQTIKKNPLRGIPNAAIILRNSLEQAVETGKKAFNTMIEHALNIVAKTKDLTPDLFSIFVSLNGYLEAVTSKPFLNNSLLRDLTPILTISVPNIAEGAKKLIQATPAA